jgi:hypothetical protein
VTIRSFQFRCVGDRDPLTLKVNAQGRSFVSPQYNIVLQQYKMSTWQVAAQGAKSPAMQTQDARTRKGSSAGIVS